MSGYRVRGLLGLMGVLSLLWGGCSKGQGEPGADRITSPDTQVGEQKLPGQAEGNVPPDGEAKAPAVDQSLPLTPGPLPRAPELKKTLKEASSALPRDYVPRTRHLEEDGSPTYTNRLLLERSPYLRQHAHNPVDWFPWGDEAFELARKLGRPVFMSIGYTTCHWCHVMEEESFEDEEIARFLNANYVPVKLDREERPDVDSVYMSAVNVLTGRGGWPMSVWLTPDREPFMAGTYFPPRDGARGSKRGFLTLIQEYSASYMQDPDGIVAQAKDLARRLQSRLQGPGHAAGVGEEALHRAASSYQRIFDKDYGGFGRGNKFPRPSNLEFLLRYFRRTGDQLVEGIVVRTLDAMALGGLYDHVDDGFHRYTTERRFRIPHFEKMLYDNAQLVPVYLAAYQVFKYPRFKQVATRTLDYVLRDLQAPEGGFFSATDADSEGEEGVFAVWTPGQVDAAVGKELSPFMKAHFNVTPRGNFEHRTTVLYTTETPEETGARLGLSSEESLRQFQEGKEAMYRVRQQREQPILDDKVLTAWNGLMISALAQGSMVIGDDTYGKAGERCARFLRETMFVDQELKRRFHSGEVRFDAVLDDYAYLIQGLLDLH